MNWSIDVLLQPTQTQQLLHAPWHLHSSASSTRSSLMTTKTAPSISTCWLVWYTQGRSEPGIDVFRLENIGYLIRTRVTILNVADVFIPMAARRDNDGDVTKSKIAVVVYNNTTNSFLTIVSVQVAQAGFMEELDDKVDAMVFRTLKDWFWMQTV